MHSNIKQSRAFAEQKREKFNRLVRFRASLS